MQTTFDTEADTIFPHPAADELINTGLPKHEVDWQQRSSMFWGVPTLIFFNYWYENPDYKVTICWGKKL